MNVEEQKFLEELYKASGARSRSAMAMSALKLYAEQFQLTSEVK
jgi:hypothetical protein